MSAGARLGAVLIGRTAAVALGLFLAGRGLGASAPDWVHAAAAADTPPWPHDGGALVLLNSTQVRFLPGGISTAAAKSPLPADCHIQVVLRGAVKLDGDMERGRSYASVSYNPGYARIISASAWILSPDGHKTDAFRIGDFVDAAAVYNNYTWDYRRNLIFPSAGRVGAGGIVAWEIKYESDEVFREFPTQFLPGTPVLREEMEAIPSPGSRLEFEAGDPRVGNPEPGAEPGSLKWTLSRQDSVPRERPTGFFANPMAVTVRSVPASEGPAERTWGELSRKLSAIIDPSIDPNDPDVRRLARSLTEGKAARWERVRALADYVQTTVVYLEITLDQDELAGMRPHSPASVLRNRYGDCKDKAALLVSMLRASGEDARVALVASGNPLAVAEAWPSMRFDHMIVLIRADGSEPPAWPAVDGGEQGRWILFDPTNPFTPLGVLAAGDGGGFSLMVAPRGGILFRAPFSDPASSRASRKIDAAIDGRGALKADVVEETYGATAAEQYGFRYQRSNEQYLDLINARVHRANPLCRDLTWTDEWHPSEAHYRLSVGFSAAGYARAMPGGLMLVSPDVLPGTAKFEPWNVEQPGTVVLGSDEVEEEVRLAIPEGYSVEELPDGWKAERASMKAEVTYKLDGGTVILTKHLSRSAGFFQKADYEELRSFYRDVHEAERRSILLRKQPIKG